MNTHSQTNPQQSQQESQQERMLPPQNKAPSLQKTNHMPNHTPSMDHTPKFSFLHFLGKIIATILWAIFHFSFCFLLQISELIAPLLLVLGLGWKMIPYALSIANKTISSGTSDTQTQDLVQHISQSIPMELTISAHHIVPSTLIFYGLALMAMASFCATACAWLGRRL